MITSHDTPFGKVTSYRGLACPEEGELKSPAYFSETVVRVFQRNTPTFVPHLSGRCRTKPRKAPGYSEKQTADKLWSKSEKKLFLSPQQSINIPLNVTFFFGFLFVELLFTLGQRDF